jgi:hypothetical protein
MSDHLEDLIVILIIAWWFQKQERECQLVNEQHEVWYGGI